MTFWKLFLFYEFLYWTEAKTPSKTNPASQDK
jgi:hypothetical protein